MHHPTAEEGDRKRFRKLETRGRDILELDGFGRVGDFYNLSEIYDSKRKGEAKVDERGEGKGGKITYQLDQ